MADFHLPEHEVHAVADEAEELVQQHEEAIRQSPEDAPGLTAAASAYLNEPCRICGESIRRSDLNSLVWAGYAKGSSGTRTAHKRCWEARKDDKANWAYPKDSD